MTASSSASLPIAFSAYELMKTITLYTKPDCPLCEKAENILLEIQREIAFHLEKVDITQDEKLFTQYRYEIPVIVLEGREFCRYRVAREALKVALGEKTHSP